VKLGLHASIVPSVVLVATVTKDRNRKRSHM
jgi:hypothetical protein